MQAHSYYDISNRLVLHKKYASLRKLSENLIFLENYTGNYAESSVLNFQMKYLAQNKGSKNVARRNYAKNGVGQAAGLTFKSDTVLPTTHHCCDNSLKGAVLPQAQ